MQLGFWLSLEIEAFDAHSFVRSLSCDGLGHWSGTLVWCRGKGQWVRIMVGSSGWGHCLGRQLCLHSVRLNKRASTIVRP